MYVRGRRINYIDRSAATKVDMNSPHLKEEWIFPTFSEKELGIFGSDGSYYFRATSVEVNKPIHKDAARLKIEINRANDLLQDLYLKLCSSKEIEEPDYRSFPTTSHISFEAKNSAFISLSV